MWSKLCWHCNQVLLDRKRENLEAQCWHWNDTINWKFITHWTEILQNSSFTDSTSSNIILNETVQAGVLKLCLIIFKYSMIVTSSKQSRRHSKLLMIDPKLGSLTYSQSQKHSLLPPVVRPHIGSFSNLGLGAGNKVLPKYSYVTLVFIILSLTNKIGSQLACQSCECYKHHNCILGDPLCTLSVPVLFVL